MKGQTVLDLFAKVSEFQTESAVPLGQRQVNHHSRNLRVQSMSPFSCPGHMALEVDRNSEKAAVVTFAAGLRRPNYKSRPKNAQTTFYK